MGGMTFTTFDLGGHKQGMTKLIILELTFVFLECIVEGSISSAMKFSIYKVSCFCVAVVLNSFEYHIFKLVSHD